MFEHWEDAATARAGYEPFDCAKAVALIGFLGLLSNFQDIIDDIVNGNGRKRRHTEPVASTRIQDVLREVLLLWDPQEEHLRNSSSGSDSYHWSENGQDEGGPGFHTASREGIFADSSLLSDLAEVGPQLALWLVDVADGRLKGEVGRRNVCQRIRQIRKAHGWAGSMMSRLLTSTMTGALGKHTYSRQLLKEAGLLDYSPC